MIKKVLFLIFLLLVLIYNLVVIYIDKNMSNKQDPSIYNSSFKIWASRGLYNNKAEQNSITSISRAFNKGALGVEVDFSYDVEMNLFIVSHDHPIKGKDGKFIYTKKNGKLLTLEEVFKQTGKNHYFWLDYKNLGQLNNIQTLQSIKRLEKITKLNSVKNRIYIEGSNPIKISLYSEAGFKTILAIDPLPDNNIFSQILINFYKIIYYYNNISVLAMRYGYIDNPRYGTNTHKNLKDIPVFLFHIPNNKNLLLNLVQEENVKVMLVGKDKSINRYSIKDNRGNR